jgi:hypothetical protein
MEDTLVPDPGLACVSEDIGREDAHALKAAAAATRMRKPHFMVWR